MAVYFINTDRISNNDISHHDEWIQRKVIVTGGEKKYREAISRVGANDVALVYANGLGVVAMGIALDNHVVDVVGLDRIGLDDVEYHKSVEWIYDLRSKPISWQELSGVLSQGPIQAVQRVNKNETALLNILTNIGASPTTDNELYIQVARNILKYERIDRPDGSLNPTRTACQIEQIARDPKVRAWSIQRANGICEMCNQAAPFLSAVDNTPFFESHHIEMLANGGSDTPENTAAICPNCHRELHFGVNRIAKSEILRISILKKEEKYLISNRRID